MKTRILKMPSLVTTGLAFTLLLGVGCGGSDTSGLKGTGGAAGAGGAGASSSGGTGNRSGSGGSAGGGQGCESSADCTSGVCDPSAKACVGCLFDSDCGASERCSNKECAERTSCKNSLDCVGAPTGAICDEPTGQCVECARSADCEGDADCIGNQCVPFDACENSLDCDLGKVCSVATGRCVGCITEVDCEAGEACVANECRVQTPCASDNQCTPLGQLCDLGLGICVDCTRDADCADVQHCSTGLCVTDVCAAGDARCQGNATVTCTPAGSGYGAPQPCGASSTCVDGGGEAQCTSWVCEAGLTYCDGSRAIDCAADGLSIVSEVDCSSSGLNCVSGACQNQVCQANATFCDGNTVRLCDPDGQGSTVFQTCASNQYCAPGSGSCVTQVCSPNQPACNGDVATTCNATGSGYSPGGTNCASTGQSCANGACESCGAGAGVSALRFVEINVGSNDYAILENTSATCDANLAGLYFLAVRGANAPLNVALPSRTLHPGERVFIMEDGGVQPGDIDAGGSITWDPSDGGRALLCAAATCAAGNVIDAATFGAAGSGTVLPSGVSFSPGPLAALLDTEQDTKSYLRTAFSGGNASFLASDWGVGAATRVFVVVPPTCPATQPTTSDTCVASDGLTCNYGSVTCTCSLFWWSCA